MNNKFIKKIMPLCIVLLIFEMIPRICQIGNPSIAEQNKIIEQEFLMLELDKSGLFSETVGNSYDIKDKNGFSYLYVFLNYDVDKEDLLIQLIEIAKKRGWTLYPEGIKKNYWRRSTTLLKNNTCLGIEFKKNNIVVVEVRYRDGVYNF